LTPASCKRRTCSARRRTLREIACGKAPFLPRDHSRRSEPIGPSGQDCEHHRSFLYQGPSDARDPNLSTRSVFSRHSITLNECGGSGQAIRLQLRFGWKTEMKDMLDESPLGARCGCPGEVVHFPKADIYVSGPSVGHWSGRAIYAATRLPQFGVGSGPLAEAGRSMNTWSQVDAVTGRRHRDRNPVLDSRHANEVDISIRNFYASFFPSGRL
jgi:hypothetical protein